MRVICAFAMVFVTAGTLSAAAVGTPAQAAGKQASREIVTVLTVRGMT